MQRTGQPSVQPSTLQTSLIPSSLGLISCFPSMYSSLSLNDDVYLLPSLSPSFMGNRFTGDSNLFLHGRGHDASFDYEFYTRLFLCSIAIFAFSIVLLILLLISFFRKRYKVVNDSF